MLYAPERLVAIAREAAKDGSMFSLEDRIGLVYDALALAKAGYADISSALALYEVFRDEKECEWSFPVLCDCAGEGEADG